MSIENDIIALIKPRTLNNPISRLELCSHLSCSDRMMRRTIEKLCGTHPIGSKTNGGHGYYYCHTAEDLAIADAEDLSREAAHRKKRKMRDYSFANQHTDVIVRQKSQLAEDWVVFKYDIFRERIV